MYFVEGMKTAGCFSDGDAILHAWAHFDQLARERLGLSAEHLARPPAAECARLLAAAADRRPRVERHPPPPRTLPQAELRERHDNDSTQLTNNGLSALQAAVLILNENYSELKKARMSAAARFLPAPSPLSTGCCLSCAAAGIRGGRHAPWPDRHRARPHPPLRKRGEERPAAPRSLSELLCRHHSGARPPRYRCRCVTAPAALAAAHGAPLTRQGLDSPTGPYDDDFQLHGWLVALLATGFAASLRLALSTLGVAFPPDHLTRPEAKPVAKVFAAFLKPFVTKPTAAKDKAYVDARVAEFAPKLAAAFCTWQSVSPSSMPVAMAAAGVAVRRHRGGGARRRE